MMHDAAPRELGGRAESSDQPLLVVERLSVEFLQRGRLIRAVRDLSYTLYPGKTLAIIGESGSGKTVSSRAIVGLLPANARVAGSIRCKGEELVGMPERRMRTRRGVAMVFQDPMRSLNPTMRIGDQITEAIRLREKMTRHEAEREAVELLQRVRMPSPRERLSDYPHQLSGGMRQRVMIAIALACQPELLIADEATSALDATTQAQIMELLRDLQDESNMGLILISHDLRLAASWTDDVLVMYAGRVAEHAPTRQLFGDVQMPYTKLLLEAAPELDQPSHSTLPVVAGSPPNAAYDVRGCAFNARCPFAEDDCRSVEPPLQEHVRHHWFACHHPAKWSDGVP